MNILPMYYYTIVVEKRSISLAAKELHITQQTLSTHIASLEKELGCKLFERRPNFKLTYAGQSFYDHAKQFTQHYISMQQEFQDIALQERGSLKLGIAYTRGLVLLPDLLEAFHKLHPKIQIQITETDNASLLTKILSSELDIIFADITEGFPELCSIPFCEEEIMLFVPRVLISEKTAELLQKEHNLKLLAKCPFLLSTQGQIVERMGHKLLQKAGIVPQVSITAQNLETLMALCARGEGACFCSNLLAKSILTKQQAAQLIPIHLQAFFPIRLAWQNKPYISKALQAFITVCQNYKIST